MKQTFGVFRDGRIVHEGGDRYVSPETIAAHQNPVMSLFWREQGERFTSGTVFLFQFPPQAMKMERRAKVAVTETRHGYVVSQAGLSAPKFTVSGHFGWQLRTVKLPDYIVPWGAKSNAVIDQHQGDIWLPLPFAHERGQVGTLEKVLRREVGVAGFTQTLDGRQAWGRLSDFVVAYFEENQRRVAGGEKPPLEMVWVDPLHGLRWVVVPEEAPSLDRGVQNQGVFPYRLELIGVYDDARPRAKKGDSVWF